MEVEVLSACSATTARMAGMSTSVFSWVLVERCFAGLVAEVIGFAHIV